MLKYKAAHGGSIEDENDNTIARQHEARWGAIFQDMYGITLQEFSVLQAYSDLTVDLINVQSYEETMEQPAEDIRQEFRQVRQEFRQEARQLD
ncbi:hypothetical protein LTR15_004212 [Elasticomyces elasticus]|nr:hypothetical protein LTR15_004212 [Elasticomyces elasticus]